MTSFALTRGPARRNERWRTVELKLRGPAASRVSILRGALERSFRDRTGDGFRAANLVRKCRMSGANARTDKACFRTTLEKLGATSGSVFGARRVRIRNVHDDEAPPQTYTPRMPTLAGPLRYRSLDKRPCVESSAAARRLIPTPIAFEALTERHWL